MRSFCMLLLSVAVLAMGGVSPALGQSRPGAGGRNYDPSTVETVRGEVVSIDRVSSQRGPGGGGVHFALKTDTETIPVHLGPAWYVDAQKTRVERGDHVEVEGSRVSYEGTPAIIARQVKKDGGSLMLRSEAGVPAWAGRGGRRGRPQK